MVCRLAGRGCLRRPCRPGPGALQHRHSAAQRDRRADDGPRAQQHPAGHPHPPRPPRGQGRPLGARHRPCRHRHADRGGARTAQAEAPPPRPRPREVPREGLGLAAGKGRHHPRAAPPPRGVVRLEPHGVHDGPGLLAARAARVRRAVQTRPHLPRQTHGELVPGVAHRPLRRGGDHEAGQGTALPGALRDRRAAGAVHRGGHHAARDHPGRRRHRGASRRPALRRASSASTSGARWCAKRFPIVADAAVDREFGTGALKITPAHDKADFEIGQRHQLAVRDVLNPDGTLNELAGPELGGPGPVRRTQEGGRAAQGRRRPREGGALREQRRLLRARRRAHRAAPHDAVVAALSARRGGQGGGARRPHQVPSGALVQGLPALAREHPGLVHQPPALVGPSHSRLVSQRARPREAHRGRSPRSGQGACVARRPRRSAELGAGGGRARHVGLVLALAVRDDGLAGRRRRWSRPASISSIRPRRS